MQEDLSWSLLCLQVDQKYEYDATIDIGTNPGETRAFTDWYFASQFTVDRRKKSVEYNFNKSSPKM